MNQFQDPTPLLEGCDAETCTQRVGGDHSPRCTAYRPDHAFAVPAGDEDLQFLPSFGILIACATEGCGRNRNAHPTPGELTELWGK